MKPDCNEGPKARENFERTMIALFKAAKPKRPKSKRKQKKKGKD